MALFAAQHPLDGGHVPLHTVEARQEQPPFVVGRVELEAALGGSDGGVDVITLGRDA